MADTTDVAAPRQSTVDTPPGHSNPACPGWVFRVVWPITDPALFDHEAIALARAELPRIAAERGVLLTGPPHICVVDCADHDWPTTAHAVVCDVPAQPAIERSAA